MGETPSPEEAPSYDLIWSSGGGEVQTNAGDALLPGGWLPALRVEGSCQRSSGFTVVDGCFVGATPGAFGAHDPGVGGSIWALLGILGPLSVR